MYTTAHLMGGLGNQMFQIANAYSQSLKKKVDCFFRPVSSTHLQGKNTSHYVSNIFRKLVFKNELFGYKTYIEPNWFYEEKNIIWDKPIEFYGYYQSSKNFLDYSDEIQNLFEIDDITKSYLIEKYPQISLRNTLSLHIRRGDYKNFPDVHPSISKSYIEKSLSVFDNISHIFIFTDDKDWVNSNLTLPNSTVVNEEDYIEIWLMSLCNHNIISNSTFSWWGAFLNKNVNKRVVAPSIWFGPSGPNYFADIFEKDWEIIKVYQQNGELITN